MNIQKKINTSGGSNSFKSSKEKLISSKNNIESIININMYRMPKNILNKAMNYKNKSTNKNSYNKSNNKKQISNSIQNYKSSKIFKIKKGPNNNQIKLSLNLSEEEPLNKNKYHSNKYLYNTITAINPRLKIFSKNENIINDINKKNKSIQNNSTRMRYSQIRCNTYSPKYNSNNDENKTKNNYKKEGNNNIIINFFNAPINRYNEEFYFNNINDMNKIIKNRKSKKKVLNVFNHPNIRNNHKDILNNNNIYPIFSSLNQGNHYNNNNNLEFQIYQNRKKNEINALENLKTIFINHSVNKTRKTPAFRESLNNYSNKYKKIKFIKNKKIKNLSIKLKGENKLKTIFKRTKNYNNIKTINKDNIVNIKQEHFFRSKTIKTEHKTKNNNHILYNLLFKSQLKTEQNHSNKNRSNIKSKKNENIISFNRLYNYKSIDVERNSKKLQKFNTLITELPPNKKSNKNKFLKKSSAKIIINNNNILNHQNNKNDMKTIITDSRGGIIAKSNILKFSKKNEGNNKVLKRSNDNLIDIGNSLKKEKDPKFLNEYLDEILCNLYLEEKDYMKKIGFQISSDILNNYGINPETRTCLIDSLIDLQKIFNFNDRTLFITVQLFDRYIALSIINDITPKLKEENLDIILTTSLLIASKIEESILYKLSDYLGILSDKYTIEDIKITENKLMNSFDFAAVSPTVLDFFEVFAEKSELNKYQKTKGLFLLNTILLDINLSQISGSVIAYAVTNIVKENVKGPHCKKLIEILNLTYKNRNKDNYGDNLDSLSLMNNDEKMDELCDLIQVFAGGILKTEYNHISIKFNCEKNDYLTKINARSSI